MPLDKIRKFIEGLPEPESRRIIDVRELLEKPPLWQIHTAFEYLEEWYQKALDHARECNIMEALYDMAQAIDAAHILVSLARELYRNGVITLDQYGDIMGYLNDFATVGLAEDVGKAILDNCW